ncbi:hypothetical protein [Chitinophaga sp.]|uniref:hypothetical protein n=1 Tax=Chitinophaga sp. TaxID=1869181 RepID=UPI0031E2CC99
MKLKSYLLLVAVLACAGSVARAQSNNSAYPFSQDAIKIDPVSLKPEKQIPFDKPFSLLLSMDDVESVVAVHAYEVKYRKWEKGDAAFNYLKRGGRIRDIALKNGVADPIPGVGMRKDVKQKLLIIDFPPMPPNFHFDFAVIKQLSGAALEKLRGYTSAIADSLIWKNKIGLKKLEISLYDFWNKIDKRVYPGQGRKFMVSTINFDLSVQGNKNTSNLYYCYDTEQLDSAYLALYNFSFAAAFPDADDAKAIYQLLAAQKTDNVGYAHLLTAIAGGYRTFYENGRLALGQLAEDSTGFFDLDQRVSNLDTSMAHLKKMRAALEKLVGVPQQSLVTAFKIKMDTLFNNVSKNREKLSKITSYINKKILGNPDMHYTQWYVSTNVVQDLQTKSSFIFTPQVGLSALYVRNNANEIKVVPKLNWGVNINFRSIDKLVGRKYLPNRTPWHYLSLHLGLTIGGFRDKEYENLYNSTSLLIGPSYRINKALYFSTGLSLFRQKDRNPLINEYNVAGGLYSTLLLDLDITNAISTIRGLLFK